MIGAILLHFLCVSGPEQNQKCNKIASINVLFLHKDWESSQSLCTKVKALVQFRCIFRAIQDFM